jgi:hypothetical protein
MLDGARTITPDSKLAELLERWPELERVLIDLSPHFRALQNPLLRRTVAKVATLRQVSRASGVPLAAIVERLRGAVGVASLAGPDDCPAAEEPRPDWASAPATRTRDARAAIERGEHPMHAVMRDLAELRAGEVYELLTPFVPAPLLDAARAKGFRAHSVTEAEDLVRTCFSVDPRRRRSTLDGDEPLVEDVDPARDPG